MRIPNLERTPSFMQKLGLVMTGIVLGCAVMTGVAQRTVQEMRYEIDALKQSNSELAEQIGNYEQVRNRRNVISRTTIEWDVGQKDFGQSTANQLRERIAADLKILVGQPVHAEMFKVYRELIDGKVYYNVNDKDYRIRLRLLSVVSSECVVYVIAEEFVPD